MRRATIPLILLCAGCALAHERGGASDAAADVGPLADAAPCLADGTYDVPVHYESSTPAGCLPATTTAVPITLPLRAADFEAMCGDSHATVTAIDACTWQLDSMCSQIDASSEVHGTFTTRDGTLRGRFEVSYSSLSGACNGIAIFGP